MKCHVIPIIARSCMT